MGILTMTHPTKPHITFRAARQRWVVTWPNGDIWVMPFGMSLPELIADLAWLAQRKAAAK